MPTKTIVQRRFEKIITENGEPTHRFMRFLEELNGNSNNFIDALSGFYEFDDISPFLATFMPKKDDIEVTNVDYTTMGDQIIICTDALIVTLNNEPRDRELVKVVISNGDVTVNGNGKQINKDTDVTVIFDNLITTGVLDIIYILETDEWFII